MSLTERRQKEANECAMYNSGEELLAEAKRKGEVVHGWVDAHFLRVYPGGRAEDLSIFVKKPPHVILIQVIK